MRRVLAEMVNDLLRARRMEQFERQQHGLGGGQGDAGPGASRIFTAPAVVSWLAVFIIAAYVAYLLSPPGLQSWIAWHGAVSPQRILHGQGGLVERLAPLVTHMLLHGGWMHLFFNTIWLMAFGAPVARRLGAEDPRTASRASVVFILLFILSGMVGAVAYIALHPGDTTLLIGASGGVFGLLGGLVRFAFRRPPALPGAFSGLFEKSVVVWTIAIFALNAIAGVFGSGLVGGDGAPIAWEAHIGGYLFGLLTFPFFAKLSRGG